ncbi:hypothetical protein [Sphingobacterium sp. SYP-B4668]|uniref:hypothetical protein n=1 Tax=Sphingobacterium sp. SYP-B4668 TaxID=2996035 RepID=UPI0022DD9672|nr:hypothetical protein [Sphingobacterium sp. SYP-B4668]
MKSLFVLFFSFYGFVLFAQDRTSGLSYVVSIESKVQAYEKNKDRIAQLRLELPELENQWKQKIKDISDKIAALLKERDNLVADMKVGARCSECQRWKTELEQEGIDFQQHLGEVKGYAVPASTSELEGVRKQYNEKIAIQKVQLQRLQKGDDAIQANSNEIDKLTKANASLCQQVTQLSKDYETAVLKEARATQEGFVQKLSDVVSDILISADQSAIQRARAARHQEEFQVQSEQIKQRLETENKELKDLKIKEIALNDRLLDAKQYQKDSISSSTNPKRDSLLKVVEAEIADLQGANHALASEISYLDASLAQKIQDKIAEIKPVLDKDIAHAQQLAECAIKNSGLFKQQFEAEVGACSKANNILVAAITDETNRMVLAGRKIECPVWNATGGEVASSWNQLLPCIRNLVSSAQVNPYCSKWNLKDYLGRYLSFVNNLAPEDLTNVKTNIR